MHKAKCHKRELFVPLWVGNAVRCPFAACCRRRAGVGLLHSQPAPCLRSCLTMPATRSQEPGAHARTCGRHSIGWANKRWLEAVVLKIRAASAGNNDHPPPDSCCSPGGRPRRPSTPRNPAPGFLLAHAARHFAKDCLTATHPTGTVQWTMPLDETPRGKGQERAVLRRKPTCWPPPLLVGGGAIHHGEVHGEVHNEVHQIGMTKEPKDQGKHKKNPENSAEVEMSCASPPAQPSPRPWSMALHVT